MKLLLSILMMSMLSACGQKIIVENHHMYVERGSQVIGNKYMGTEVQLELISVAKIERERDKSKEEFEKNEGLEPHDFYTYNSIN